ncbi:nucleotidyl transferase AbiEii/AbiGii toxin family protein [Glaciibacter superstes]|uniref:nucleotidyl transferase AbiEii/AbiGii toxin family protein n=1 Tax=Glaciibacter superstes TaxID=501023 RepID=UPI0003B6A192|nr:nucleotidyl transferase AbiEii/AbiGii toxin family protein [Glaciibacter superstes]
MGRLRDDSIAFETLVDATAAALEIDPAFVEKDFWVIESLRAATVYIESSSEAAGATLIFKGGTSLSRVYELIERFSEDVDLLFGFPDSTGESRRERVLKGVSSAVREHLGLSIEHAPSDSQTRGVSRSTRYFYPILKSSTAISAGVYLEMGTRGGTFPTSDHDVRSMVARHAIETLDETPDAWDEFAAVRVTVLSPERTLLEKLTLLNTFSVAFESGDAEALDRHGRHLYDIHQLLNDAGVAKTLNELGRSGVDRLCRDIQEQSHAAGFACAPRPAGGFGGGAIFSKGSRANERLNVAYQSALDLVYGSKKPSFEDCVKTIVRTNELL